VDLLFFRRCLSTSAEDLSKISSEANAAGNSIEGVSAVGKDISDVTDSGIGKDTSSLESVNEQIVQANASGETIPRFSENKFESDNKVVDNIKKPMAESDIAVKSSEDAVPKIDEVLVGTLAVNEANIERAANIIDKTSEAEEVRKVVGAGDEAEIETSVNLFKKSGEGAEVGGKSVNGAELGSGKVNGGDVVDWGNNAINNNLKVITDIINKNGLTIDEFNKLRLTNPSELLPKQVKTMQAIRDEIPKIDTNTFIQKTIPEGDIEGYLSNGWNQIGGYVAKYDDVSHIKNYDDVVESSRLDYVLKDGTMPYPENGNVYGYIKFTPSETNGISIPYGEIFGGTNTDGAPCTLNGFTGARNGEIIPEWMFDNRVTPDEGSELHKVVDGSDKIIGIFDGTKFVPIN
jgi:hypothetical protein